jgi:hypothetical protein
MLLIMAGVATAIFVAYLRYTPIKMIRANNVLKYQSLYQSLVQYIIQVIHSHTILLFKYKTLQQYDETN